MIYFHLIFTVTVTFDSKVNCIYPSHAVKIYINVACEISLRFCLKLISRPNAKKRNTKSVSVIHMHSHYLMYLT